MSQIFESLKGLICPTMVPTAARIVGEKESNVNSAVSSIFASLLGVMLKNGNSPQMRNTLESAGNLDILSNIGNICGENPTAEQRKVGDDYLQLLLGDKAASFTNPIAKSTGVSSVGVNRLVAMLSPVVAGYFGKKLVKDGWSLHKIISEIDNQKRSFESYVPNELAKNFGIASLLNTTTTTSGNVPEKKKSNGWITWLIIILALLLLIFLWRSCRNRTPESYSTLRTDTLTSAPASLNRPVLEVDRTDRIADRDMTDLTLNNGTRLSVFTNGTEDAIVRFLRSDDYMNATDEDLREKWFEFDNISFEYGSSTELNPGSREQINNIAEILKDNKDVKVRIAGMADRRGSEEVNMELSKERAKTIENLLDRAGVGSQVVKTEGFGEEYATRSENASDSERAKDRDVAFRFVK